MTFRTPDSAIDLDRYPIGGDAGGLLATCRNDLARSGACILEGFLRADAVPAVLAGVQGSLDQAFYQTKRHNPYLIADDPALPADHPRNRRQRTDSATLAYDLIPSDSLLSQIYLWPPLRAILAEALGFNELHPYADPLGALNILVYPPGSTTGWHFDNANFVVTLLLQPAETGGIYQYAPFIRTAERENYDAVGRVLDSDGSRVQELSQGAGALVLFQGRNTLHRVTAVGGAKPRVVAVFSYHSEPGKMLTEHTRRTFYGRVA